MTQSLNLALIPGDGIGPEVINEAVESLIFGSAGVLDVRVTTYPHGADHSLKTGEILSEETLVIPNCRAESSSEDYYSSFGSPSITM
jgi:3-isopropylmalate dehydrogenase